MWKKGKKKDIWTVLEVFVLVLHYDCNVIFIIANIKLNKDFLKDIRKEHIGFAFKL